MRLIKYGNDSDSPAVDDWGDGAAAPVAVSPTREPEHTLLRLLT